MTTAARDTMLPDFLKALLQAYTAPQASVRAILSTRAGFGTALLLVVLGYLLTTIVVIVTPGAEATRSASLFDRHFFGLISTMVSFFAVSALIYFFGKVSGGVGTREETYVMLGWYSVVTAILTAPVQMMVSGFKMEGEGEAARFTEVPSGAVILLALVAGVLSVRLLAHFIAELHGFRNFWGVVGVVIAFPIGLSVVLIYLVGALAALSG